MKPIIIGLSGKARAGKDTTADLLLKLIYEKTGIYGAKRSFAEKVKDIASDLFQWDGSKELTGQQDTGRQLLINIGCKMREIRPSVWVDAVVKEIKESGSDIFCIPDVRFPNELDIIRNNSGIIIRVERSNGQLLLDDKSETSCDVVFDYTIQNEDNIDNLKDKVNVFYESYLKVKFPMFDTWEKKRTKEKEQAKLNYLKRKHREE
jgi:hypothetical protein